MSIVSLAVFSLQVHVHAHTYVCTYSTDQMQVITQVIMHMCYGISPREHHLSAETNNSPRVTSFCNVFHTHMKAGFSSVHYNVHLTILYMYMYIYHLIPAG